jgi:hypothetical protein
MGDIAFDAQLPDQQDDDQLVVVRSTLSFGFLPGPSQVVDNGRQEAGIDQ